MKVFVGNLSDETNEGDLRQAFESFGLIRSITIVRDGVTHKSRGFGFVIMPSVNEAKNAIEKTDGKDLRGRKINVKKARTKRKPRGGIHRRNDLDSANRVDKGERDGSGGNRHRRHH